MKRYSLTIRMALLFAILSFGTLSLIGITLYHGIEKQLTLHDDDAFITRVERLRTLMQNQQSFAVAKDQAMTFTHLLGDNTTLLTIRVAGQSAILDINPKKIQTPPLTAIAENAPLSMNDLYRAKDRAGSPFVVVKTLAHIQKSNSVLEITVGQVMNERALLLKNCRDRILIQIALAALLFAFAGYWLVRRGLRPLSNIVEQTESITVHNLATRIESSDAPAELLPVIESFNAMLERMRTGFAKLSQVSADMAHDIRTPIANLLGQTEVALNQARSAEYYEALLASNWEELKRISKMIDSMLFLARSENAETEIERRQLNVSNELACVTEYFEVLAEERDLLIVAQGSGTLYADPVLLRRALANLMANAVQYADPHTTILLQSRQLENGVELFVENSGPAIEQHHLKRIFDRFYRADASRRGSSDASGLGLSIVRTIMTLHQGACWASSAHGLTRFTLFFQKLPMPQSTMRTSYETMRLKEIV